jgi:hypothetical protein
VRIRYRGNISTEPLPSNDKGNFTEPLPSNDRGTFTESMPSNDKGDAQRHTHTHTKQRDLISRLSFQNKYIRLNMNHSEQDGVAVAFWTRTREVFGSSLGRNIVYPSGIQPGVCEHILRGT